MGAAVRSPRMLFFFLLLVLTFSLFSIKCSAQEPLEETAAELSRSPPSPPSPPSLPPRRSNLKVVLHAQAAPTPSLVVGSILTTSGLKSAMSRYPDAALFASNETFPIPTYYPFMYDSLVRTSAKCVDVVIIEGYFMMIHAFIHEVRRLSAESNCPRPPTILFWSLDPDFPSQEEMLTFDVDAFLTNSNSLKLFFQSRNVKVSYVPLAVDEQLFTPPPPLPAGTPPPTDIVFVGSAGAIVSNSKRSLLRLLTLFDSLLSAHRAGLPPSAPAPRLVLYGSSWDLVPSLSHLWGGVLPVESLPDVYRRSLAVIGWTMDAQRDAGMVNNRVFEALASGATFISDHFEELEEMFGDSIKYVREEALEEDVTRLLGELLTPPSSFVREPFSLLASHTYQSRVSGIIEFLETSLWPSPSTTSIRPSRPTICVLFSSPLIFTPLSSPFLSALSHLSSQYSVKLLTVSDVLRYVRTHGPQTESPWYLPYDFVVAYGGWGSPADLLLRSKDHAWPKRWKTSKGLPQYRALYLSEDEGMYDMGRSAEKEDLIKYDVMFVRSTLEKDYVSELVELREAGGVHVQRAYGADVYKILAGAMSTEEGNIINKFVADELPDVGIAITRMDVMPWGEETRRKLLSGAVLAPATVDAEVVMEVEVGADSGNDIGGGTGQGEGKGETWATVLIREEDASHIDFVLQFPEALRRRLKFIKQSELWKLCILVPRSRHVVIHRPSDPSLATWGWDVDANFLSHVVGSMAVGSRFTTSMDYYPAVPSPAEWGDRLKPPSAQALLERAIYRPDEVESEKVLADNLALGLARGLCLGKSTATIRLAFLPLGGEGPQGSDMLAVAEIDNFLVARDGCWCLWAGNKRLFCAQQDALALKLVFRDVEAVERAALIEKCASEGKRRAWTIHAAISGNVYSDAIARTPEIDLFPDELNWGAAGVHNNEVGGMRVVDFHFDASVNTFTCK